MDGEKPLSQEKNLSLLIRNYSKIKGNFLARSHTIKRDSDSSQYLNQILIRKLQVTSSKTIDSLGVTENN